MKDDKPAAFTRVLAVDRARQLARRHGGNYNVFCTQDRMNHIVRSTVSSWPKRHRLVATILPSGVVVEAGKS